MKKLKLLSAYFHKHFPNYKITGTAYGMGWTFWLDNNRINFLPRFGRYLVQIDGKFFYPQSMTEAFQILKERLQ